jgi:hypothetical protein
VEDWEFKRLVELQEKTNDLLLEILTELKTQNPPEMFAAPGPATMIRAPKAWGVTKA